jgi:hypothetical protein
MTFEDVTPNPSPIHLFTDLSFRNPKSAFRNVITAEITETAEKKENRQQL